jgi:hypothetical protein
MPHGSLKILPGVDANKTPTLNEAAISYSQLIRFIFDRTLGGLVQKLGGWTRYFSTPVGSVVRCLWAWEDTNSASHLAIGAEGSASGSLQVISSGVSLDVTPQKDTFNVAVSVSTTAGSNVVTITDTGRNVSAYDVVDIQTQISVGGIVLFGQYQCYNVGGSANTYTIYATNVLGGPNLAIFTTTTAPLAVTGASGTGTVATVTFTGAYVFPIGSVVSILSVNPSGYNGKYVVTASGAGTVSFASTTTTAYVSGGNVSNNGAVAQFVTTFPAVPSNVVTTTLANHGYVPGDTFPVLIASTVGGITLQGNYIVDTVTTSTFTFGAQTTASSAATASMNSGNAHYVYYRGTGALPAGTGYGIGGYGRGGYGTGSAPVVAPGTPITATDWTLDNWGEDLVACPLNGPIYIWSPTGGSPRAEIIPEAPSVNDGVFVAMPQRQIIAWGSTYTGIKDPLFIRWSDVANYSQWIASVTNQAGSYRIPKGSRIVQCIQAGQQGLVWTDLGVWAMQYSGPPYVYQFNELGTGCGLIGRKAAASIGGVVYWMGQSQFYRMAGSGVEPIRCPVWDVVFQDLDITNHDKIRVATNSRFNEISWFYPTNSNGGEINAYVKYNIGLDQWDYGTLSRTAWINESVLGPPIGAGILPGGAGNYIIQHETSSDAVNASGQAIAMNSSFQTGYFVLTEADYKMFVDQIWPDMKWGYFGGTQGANVLLTFYVTDYPGQTPITYGPYTMTQATTYITPRFRGRLVSIKVESNDIGSFWRLGNTRYRYQPDGRY